MIWDLNSKHQQKCLKSIYCYFTDNEKTSLATKPNYCIYYVWNNDMPYYSWGCIYPSKSSVYKDKLNNTQ